MDARANQGKWLLRIDDIDTPRNQPGAASAILSTLEAFGLEWDGEVYYQSKHLDEYNYYLTALKEQGFTYRCKCSRKTLAELNVSSTQDQANQADNSETGLTPQAHLVSIDGQLQNQGESGIYPGICRDKTIPDNIPCALRVKTDDRIVTFSDGIQGKISHNLARQDGDFIIKRKDGIIAYTFAVVIDDHLQGINHIVRGYDLLDETPKHIYLQQLMGFTNPAYQHVPIVVDQQGHKLSKQTLATAVDSGQPIKTLFELLVLLKQNPPDELKGDAVNELLDWAIVNWGLGTLALCRTINS